MTMKDNVCECCGQRKESLAGVANIPGIAVSIAWCRECLDARVVPYWAAVDNTAVLGGMGQVHPAWREVVEATLAYFKVTHLQFERDVARTIRDLDERRA